MSCGLDMSDLGCCDASMTKFDKKSDLTLLFLAGLSGPCRMMMVSPVLGMSSFNPLVFFCSRAGDTVSSGCNTNTSSCVTALFVTTSYIQSQ